MRNSNGKQALIEDALMKRALGYDTEEVTEEYGENEGESRLIKRKVTRKNIPPDITAAKLLLDTLEREDLSSLTREQLEQEKQRLLDELYELNKNKKEKGDNRKNEN